MQTIHINFIGYVFAAIIVILLLSFRMRRMRRRVPLRWKRLWIAPTILAVMAALTLTRVPLRWLDWGWLSLALVIGGLLGWQRGRLVSISLDPTNRMLTMQATPMAIYFLLGLLVIRFGLRTGLEAQGWGLGPDVVNGIFVVFAAGLFMAQGLEMAIRARRLLTTDSVQVSAGRGADANK
jgi:hypothetical protein